MFFYCSAVQTQGRSVNETLVLCILPGKADAQLADREARMELVVVLVELHQLLLHHPVCSLLGIGVGGVMGLINGVVIYQGRVAPFIATLATMTIFRGLALVVTDGRPVTGLHSDFFSMLGGGYVASLVPVPVIWMLVAFAVLWFVLRKTTFGRHVYAIGGNEEASLISGVRVSQIKPASSSTLST